MILLNPFVYATGGGGGGGSAPTFVTGSSDVTYSNGNRTAVTAAVLANWAVIPLSAPIPTSGKWYVEFDTSGVTVDNQMFGVSASGSVDPGHYLGQPGSAADGVSVGDGARLNGSLFSWVDSTSFASGSGGSVGVRADADAGRIRWYLNGVLQTADASYTGGTSGLYFAIGSYFARGTVTLKLAADATIPSGYSYLT